MAVYLIRYVYKRWIYIYVYILIYTAPHQYSDSVLLNIPYIIKARVLSIFFSTTLNKYFIFITYILLL